MLTRDDKTAAGVVLREVPAIGLVARAELQQTGSYTKALKGLVNFVLLRAIRVKSSLDPHEPEPPDLSLLDDLDNWREVRVDS